jgi:hypothetical protein
MFIEGIAWSPSGTQIAYSRRIQANQANIYTFPVNTGVETLARSESGIFSIWPDWTRDQNGTDWIFFTKSTSSLSNLFRFQVNSPQTAVSVPGLSGSANGEPSASNPVTIASAPPTLSDYNTYIIDQNGTRLTAAEPTVFQAVSKTGRALLSGYPAQFPSSIQGIDVYGVMTFRRVMVSDPTFQTSDPMDWVIGIVMYSQRPTVDCQTYDINGGSPANLGVPQAIVTAINSSIYSGRTLQSIIGCHANVNLTEYTVVHELGHVFDGRSTNGGVANTIANTQATPILDTAFPCSTPPPGYAACPPLETLGRPYVVMGNAFRSGQLFWIRGERGWGSGPLYQVTTFQQHILPAPPYDTANPDAPNGITTAYRETAADMFLNWIYRKLDPNGSQVGIAPGNWSGYLNKSWMPTDPRWGVCDGSANGCIDYSYPGDARFNWMNPLMANFLHTRWA